MSEVQQLEARIVELQAALAAAERLIAELRRDLIDAQKPDKKRRNPMLALCGGSSSEEEQPAPKKYRRIKRTPSPGRTIVDDMRGFDDFVDD